MVDPSVLQGESLNAFNEGVGYILNGWSTLQTAIDYKWGGDNSHVKPKQLIADVRSWFVQSEDALHIDELKTLINGEMDAAFDLVIRDGSDEHMIAELMTLHEECLNGDFRTVAILREKKAGVRHRHSCSELSSESVTSAISTNSTATSKPKLDTEALLPSKLLLAGYLAHEYLTKGTLMGKPWVPSRETTQEVVVEEEGEEVTEYRKQDQEERYKEVTWLLQNDETHLEGVVNPSQLSPYL